MKIYQQCLSIGCLSSVANHHPSDPPELPHGVRWQSAAATPLWIVGARPIRKNRQESKLQLVFPRSAPQLSNMYRWRNLTPEQREAELAFRKLQQRPHHSPSHHADGNGLYLITSTCYEHQPIIHTSDERMDAFSAELVRVLHANADRLDAWVVLPNHYHAVVLTGSCSKLLRALGQLHGRTSFAWNGEDEARGRKVWFNTLDRTIRGDAHHIASVHYVHHNPVKHGHVKRWDEWKWSSAAEYIQRIGREEVERRWRECPLLNFGQGWDD